MAENHPTTFPEMRGFAPGYFVTECGRVFSMKPKNGCGGTSEPRELKQRVNHRGYSIVGNWRVNRAIAIAWIGPPPTPSHEARHLDGVRAHNHINNISWGTPKENCADRKRHGTQAPPATQVLSADQANLIIDAADVVLHGDTVSVKNKWELADRFGVSEGQVRGIVMGKSWPSLDAQRTSKLAPLDDLREQIRTAAGKMTERKAAKAFGVSVTTIGTIWGKVGSR